MFPTSSIEGHVRAAPAIDQRGPVALIPLRFAHAVKLSIRLVRQSTQVPNTSNTSALISETSNILQRIFRYCMNPERRRLRRTELARARCPNCVSQYTRLALAGAGLLVDRLDQLAADALAARALGDEQILQIAVVAVVQPRSDDKQNSGRCRPARRRHTRRARTSARRIMKPLPGDVSGSSASASPCRRRDSPPRAAPMPRARPSRTGRIRTTRSVMVPVAQSRWNFSSWRCSALM